MAHEHDDFDLDRFVAAQETTYATALAELRAGDKRSHWIWWVFPQIAGLGPSPTSVKYAVSSLDEARAYLAHPVLGPRLHEAARTLLDLPPTDDAVAVLGGVDAMKLRSSMTLFAAADPDDETFEAVLARFFDSQHDPHTLRRLA
ncbi:DUF1810 domain-containing protein [Kineococcus gynurae]|uniref:DUF1810 domain-containing protein n=1 Tax=Kineococcus gynurae TaxID=452979 RepID=A0ABV5LWL6_9ACTN